MAWDLRRALLKKGEVESARLADFEFRLRARTMRLLEESLRLTAGTLVARIAETTDETILAELAARSKSPHEELAGAYQEAREEARGRLIRERGNPAPHRLA
jgi:hypothetical protein